MPPENTFKFPLHPYLPSSKPPAFSWLDAHDCWSHHGFQDLQNLELEDNEDNEDNKDRGRDEIRGIQWHLKTGETCWLLIEIRSFFG